MLCRIVYFRARWLSDINHPLLKTNSVTSTVIVVIFYIFAKLKITEMKRFIVILAMIVFGIGVFSACAAHTKCPAYGHYSQAAVEQVDPQSI